MRFLSVSLILLLSGTGPLSFAAGSSGALTEDQRILHLLGRITFGPRPGDIERLKQIGAEAFLSQQLNPSEIDDSEVTKRVAHLGTLKMSPGELFAAYPPPGFNRRLREKSQSQDKTTREEARMDMVEMRRNQRRVQLELAQAKLVRAVYSERQLLELMVDFWMNHFNVFMLKQWTRLLTTDFEENVIRSNALGKFEDLLSAVAKSPAMLYYLDNWLSSAPEEVVR